MGKAFGIAALVLSIVGIFIPFSTLYLSALALALASVAVFFGDRILAPSAWLLCLINVLFLSPFLYLAIAGDNSRGASTTKWAMALVLIVPLCAMIAGFVISRGRSNDATGPTAIPKADAKPTALGSSSPTTSANAANIQSDTSSQNVESSALGVGSTHRACPFCAETIRAEAKKCRYCGSAIEPLSSIGDPIVAEPVAASASASQALIAQSESKTVRAPSPPHLPPQPSPAPELRRANIGEPGDPETSIPDTSSDMSRGWSPTQLALSVATGVLVIAIGSFLYFHNRPAEPGAAAVPAQNAVPATTVNPTQSATNAPIASAGQAALNGSWYGPWKDPKTSQKLDISAARFNDCMWVANPNEIPKRAGCWAHYGQTLTLNEILGSGRAKLAASVAGVAQTMSPTDRYKAVTLAMRDEHGEEYVPHCSSTYFWDRMRVIRRDWCDEGSLELFVFLPDRSAPPDIVISIGHVGPTTGQIGHLGRDNENGARLAIEEANTRGLTFEGQRIRFQLLTENDSADAVQAVQVAKKLADSNIVGVVGHLNSGTSIPASAVYNRAGIAQISPSATNPKLTAQGFRNVFRMMANDRAQGSAIGAYAVTGLGGKNIAVIHDGSAYGVGLTDDAEKAIKSAGGTVIARETTGNPKEQDFTNLTSRLATLKPDVVVFGGMDAQAGPLLKQMKTRGLSVKFLGGDGVQSSELIKLAGTASEGIYAATAGANKDRMPQGQVFYEKYKARFHVDVQAYAPFSYDATNLLIGAIQKVGTDAARIIDEVRRSSSDGVTGKIAFDDRGDIKNGAVTIYQVKGGKWDPVQVVAVSAP